MAMGHKRAQCPLNSSRQSFANGVTEGREDKVEEFNCICEVCEAEPDAEETLCGVGADGGEHEYECHPML